MTTITRTSIFRAYADARSLNEGLLLAGYADSEASINLRLTDAIEALGNIAKELGYRVEKIEQVPEAVVVSAVRSVSVDGARL